jgi:hypothetical protein
MKQIFILASMLMSAPTLASNTIEFDEALEVKCYQEAERLGCRDDDEKKLDQCLERKSHSFSEDCKEMLTIKRQVQ